ncbi:MAG: hypothetical protein GQ572_09525 [Gammaproteobacteria bacterium]|nr:hypothetical protein [Gammaproteobacteria bacterium]
MKAIVFTKYGSPDVLQLQEVEKAVPKDYGVHKINNETPCLVNSTVMTTRNNNVCIHYF